METQTQNEIQPNVPTTFELNYYSNEKPKIDGGTRIRQCWMQNAVKLAAKEEDLFYISLAVSDHYFMDHCSDHKWHKNCFTMEIRCLCSFPFFPRSILLVIAEWQMPWSFSFALLFLDFSSTLELFSERLLYVYCTRCQGEVSNLIRSRVE